VHPCSDAKSALELADTLSNLKLIISDYMMPDTDGFEFARLIRRNYKKDKVAFIGVSSTQSEQVSAKFIKFGANDFMMKPFSNEQFYTRVNQNVQTVLMIENIRELSFKDYLTGLYNRRYFFNEMENIFDPQSEKTLAMLDIDYFKKVNDTYGHDGGDEVLRSVALLLSESVGEGGLVSRFGGEEFCIYLNTAEGADYFEALRLKIEGSEIKFGEETIRVTTSIGYSNAKGLNITEMISNADTFLYAAKTSGRNRVCSKS